MTYSGHVHNLVSEIPLSHDEGLSLRALSQGGVLNALLKICTKKSKGADDLEPYLLHLSAHLITQVQVLLFKFFY